MQQPEANNTKNMLNLANRQIAFPVAVMFLQIVGAVFFVLDSIEDQISEARQGFSPDAAMEGFIGLALLGGIILSSRYIAQLRSKLRWQEHSLSIAKGALAEHIAQRFREWSLTPGEGDVALFALKGFDVSEIARLRGAAAGTVRSQLSQVYTKAGVTSQAMLVSLFIDDLLDTAPLELALRPKH